MKVLYFGCGNNIFNVYIKVSTISLSCLVKELLKWILGKDSGKNVAEVVVSEEVCRSSYFECCRYHKCICSKLSELATSFSRAISSPGFDNISYGFQIFETVAIDLLWGTPLILEFDVAVSVFDVHHLKAIY